MKMLEALFDDIFVGAQDGICAASETPDDWFPNTADASEATEGALFGKRTSGTSRRKHAEQVNRTYAANQCSGCPVLAECRTFALTNQIRDGVWGGLSESDRAAILRREDATKAAA